MLYYFIALLLFKRKEFFLALLLLPAILILLAYGEYVLNGVNLFKQLLIYNIQYDSDFHINKLVIGIFLMRTVPLILTAGLNLRDDNKVLRLLAYFSLGSVVLSLLALLRMGSNLNYTYESSILLVINGAVYFHRLMKSKISWNIRWT